MRSSAATSPHQGVGRGRGSGWAWREWWQDPRRSYYFIGKDNIDFHAIIWPGMLIGYVRGLNLPYDVPTTNT